MSDLSIIFAPQLPLWAIIAFVLIGGAFVMLGLIRRVRGGFIRALSWGLLTLALFNPSIAREDRENIKSVIAVVTDRSTSQTFGERKTQTDAVHAAITGKIGKIDKFELREIETSDQVSSTTDISTALFRALSSVLQDVPPEQVGGAVLITDGQVHDIPENLNTLGINAPLHALITGKKDETDRRITITNAPKFAVVGETITLQFRVDQHGISDTQVEVTVLVDGDEYSVEQVVVGQENEIYIDTPHGGKTIIELKVKAAPGELTLINNRAFTSLNGIRENLRVLLVSGEPHAGERTWRNLLKSDPSVDLVHFTILRPPEKQDGTPINELSLIAFPTRELFVEKIDEFDLIIFDRYRRRNVLLSLFFDNIARYVEDGGAILVAAGPEFSDGFSIAQTALQRILPALPDGRVLEAPYKPKISDLGAKHPVTRDLNPDPDKPPKWSRWFRSIGAGNIAGKVVMNAEDENPLLILNRIGEGRVALFLSDHVWLWAREFEGGGPYIQLLRRLAHWLMKEPDLSEEALTAKTKGDEIIIQRQTLEADVDEIEILTPDQKTIRLKPEEISPGIFEARLKGANIGLYQANNGDFTALTHLGPVNPREFSQVISTPQLLKPLVEKSGGAVLRANQNQTPRVIPIRNNSSTKGNGWIGLRDTQASILRGVSTVPIFNGLVGLALLILTFGAMWTREGR